MKTVTLTPATVLPWLCFGCGPLGTALRGHEAEAVVAAFLEAGGTFFDTAHVYAGWEWRGSGKSERELARVLKVLGATDRVFVATKGGHPAFGRYYRRPEDFLSKRQLRRDIDDSRKRLGVDRLDLWYLHRDDGTTPIPELVERCATYLAEGKIARLGASNWSPERIQAFNHCAAAQGVPGICVSSVQCSLALPSWKATADPTMRTVDRATLDFHRETRTPLVSWSASAGGWFAGKPEDGGPWDSEFNRAMRGRVREFANTLGVDPAALALAWQRTLGFPVAACIGAHRQETIAAVVGADRIEIPDSVTAELTELRFGSHDPV